VLCAPSFIFSIKEIVACCKKSRSKTLEEEEREEDALLLAEKAKSIPSFDVENLASQVELKDEKKEDDDTQQKDLKRKNNPTPRLINRHEFDITSSSSLVLLDPSWTDGSWCFFLVLLYKLLWVCIWALDLRHDSKDHFQHANDIMELVVRGIVLFRCGNFLETRKKTWLFLPLLLYSLMFYVFTYQVCPQSFQLSQDFHGSLVVTVILVTTGLIIFYVLVRNLAYHLQHLFVEGIHWLVAIGAILVFHSLLFSEKGSGVHLHHHWNGWLMALMCRAPNTSSVAVQAVGCAMFIHGVVFFGVEPLFDVDN